MGRLNTLALIAMVLGPPQAPNVGGPRPWKKIRNGGKEGRKCRDRRQKKKEKLDRTRKRRKDERGRTFGLHPSSIICLSCRCGRQKGRGKKKSPQSYNYLHECRPISGKLKAHTHMHTHKRGHTHTHTQGTLPTFLNDCRFVHLLNFHCFS